MLSTVELRHNINVYKQQYTAAQSLREMLLPSKAALLEVCGWLEQAMDHLVIDCSNRCQLSPSRLQSIQNDYVKKTYGFEYKRHFEKMLTAVVGFKVLEQVETQIGATTLTPFTASISSLVPLRNHYAHTHLDTAQPYPQNVTAIPSPSTLIQFVTQAESALISLENALIELNC